MAYEASMKNLLNLGYVQASSTDEQAVLSKSAKQMRINTRVANGYIYGDDLFQKPFNTTALSGISLATSAATDTSAVEAFDVNTFVDAEKSSNYTVNTTGKLIKATSTASDCVIVSNSYTVTANKYCVLKTGTETLGTGSISYFISRDNGVTFKQIYANKGQIMFTMPTGTSFVFKVVITGNSQLAGGIGFSLR